MPKLYIMRGIPGSGKSFFAKKLIAEQDSYYEPFVRLNRDLLREMLNFGKYSPENEAVIVEIEKFLVIKFLLEKCSSVVVDDTNIKDGNIEDWISLARKCDAKPILYTIQAPLELCIARDKERANSVGEDVIRRMHEKLYWDNKNFIDIFRQDFGCDKINILVRKDGKVWDKVCTGDQELAECECIHGKKWMEGDNLESSGGKACDKCLKG